MAQIIYSPASVADLREIWDYVAEDSIIQADRLLSRFRQKLEHLAKWNTIGRPRPELAPNCRSYPTGKYCIYYQPIGEGAGIVLLRLLHSSRDIRQIKFSI